MGNQTYTERLERKYELAISKSDLPAFCRDVGRHIPLHEFIAGRLTTRNSTLYFDSEDYVLLRDGLLNRFDHIKIRARKYDYDSASLSTSPYCWMELKIKKGEVTKKDRLKLEWRDLQGLLAGRTIDKRVLDSNRSRVSPEACKRLYAQIQNIIAEKGLKPVLLVTYERMAFENGSERLTVDWDIRYYKVGSPVPRLKSLEHVSKTPVGCERALTLELKYSGELPSWMLDLRRKYPICYRSPYSKLVRGTKALLKGPLKCRQDSDLLLGMIHAREQQGEVLSERL